MQEGIFIKYLYDNKCYIKYSNGMGGDKSKSIEQLGTNCLIKR